MVQRFSIDLDERPKQEKKKRQRFEVRNHFDPYSGLYRKDVFVDDKLFEWEVDEKSWQKLLKLSPGLAQAAQIDILNHFCICLSEFLGRKVTPGQVMMAIQTGWI